MKKAMKSQRQVSVNNLYPTLDFDSTQVESLFRCLDDHSPFSIHKGELEIALLNNEEIIRLHDQFLQDPTPTDVITFPANEEDELAGQICISIDYAQSSAIEHNSTLSEEITLYLVHGWLHLAGLDDKKPSLKKQMREAEAQTLLLLKEHGELPQFLITNKDNTNDA